MRTLTLSTGSFDTDTTFSVNLGRRYSGFRCMLFCGYQTKDDNVLWIMQCAAVLSDSRSAAEEAERIRLHAETPVENGDIVLVDGAQYKVRVIGNYSDCAILEAI